MKKPLIVPYVESSVCIVGVNPKNVSIFVSSRGGNRSQCVKFKQTNTTYLRFQPT